MTNRAFNIFSILLILLWIWADRYLQFGSPSYGWILLVYVTVLFCGSYFIRLGFFLKSICSVKTNEKWIALSFDDGPAAQTSLILDILRDHQAEASFFCIGQNIAGNEEQLLRMIREGHVIGNHSWSHHFLFDLFSGRKMLDEINKMNSVVKEITGRSPRLFRPPYGVTNPNLKKAILKGNMISIGWSIRSYDTIIRNPDRLLNRIFKAMKPGCILLLHDTVEITATILPDLLKGINERGFKVIRLDKMINQNPYD